MALSIFTESGAPRDFRVSTTESEGHYKKCLLCFTVKKNFYCPDCIRAGNFVHSSMPYSDRFAEKQAKLLRLKANRRHVLDRCEKLLAPKIKKDALLTEAKQSRDKIDLLRLAIEQRKNNVVEKRKELTELRAYNNELRQKLPRYQKRVTNLGKHAQNQRMELQNKISVYNDQGQSLAALRRSRIRQLTNYIFPVYMTYDSSDSIEDLEFVGSDCEAVEVDALGGGGTGWAGGAAGRRAQLHIVGPSISADADFTDIQAWAAANKEEGPGTAAPGPGSPVVRAACALGLCAQLVALLAYALDVRLPHALPLSEYVHWRGGGAAAAGGLGRRARRLCACAAALLARAGVPPAATACAGGAAPRPLAGLHALCTAAAADSYALGSVEAGVGGAGGAWAQWAEWAAATAAADYDADGDDEPPEHLHWPEPQEMEELSCTPPPAPSLVTSAAASIASIWRGWTK